MTRHCGAPGRVRLPPQLSAARAVGQCILPSILHGKCNHEYLVSAEDGPGNDSLETAYCVKTYRWKALKSLRWSHEAGGLCVSPSRCGFQNRKPSVTRQVACCSMGASTIRSMGVAAASMVQRRGGIRSSIGVDLLQVARPQLRRSCRTRCGFATLALTHAPTADSWKRPIVVDALPARMSGNPPQVSSVRAVSICPMTTARMQQAEHNGRIPTLPATLAYFPISAASVVSPRSTVIGMPGSSISATAISKVRLPSCAVEFSTKPNFK